MATVSSSTSAGSSIDVQGIVSQLMQVEQKPLTALQTKISGVDTKVSSIGKIKSALSTLQTAAQGLTSLDTWRAATATSSDDKVVSATTTPGAPTGAFPIRVDQLARPQTAMSAQLAGPDAVIGGGTLTIQLGNWDDTGKIFTPSATQPATPIVIPANATLADIRTAINSAAPGIGATLVNDGGKTRLMLRGSAAGADGAFQITVADADGNNGDATGLSQLSVDPAGGGNLPLTQTALDAKFNLGGVDMTAASNTIANVVDGLTLNLKQVSTTPTNIEVSNDTESMRKALDKFVTAYNDAMSTISGLTSYDATNKKAATLQGDASVRTLQTSLHTLITQTIGTGKIASLSAAGVAVQRDGSLAVNGAKFTAAAADPAALKTLFSNVDANVPGNVGIAKRIDTFIGRALGVDGSITGELNSLQSRKTGLNKQVDRVNAQLDATQKRLIKLYSTLDANLTKMSTATAYIDKLTSSTGNNG